jgi:hypothetical protein
MRASLKRRVPSWRWLALMPVVCCISCSSDNGLNPVHGKVLYKGEPLKGVLVTFHPKEEDINFVRPVGLTGEDGAFSLTTGDNEGAPAGEYVLTFICSEDAPSPKSKAMSMNMSVESVDRLKGAYAERSSSTIEIEVKPGTNELEPFQLK